MTWSLTSFDCRKLAFSFIVHRVLPSHRRKLGTCQITPSRDTPSTAVVLRGPRADCILVLSGLFRPCHCDGEGGLGLALALLWLRCSSLSRTARIQPRVD